MSQLAAGSSECHFIPYKLFKIHDQDVLTSSSAALMLTFLDTGRRIPALRTSVFTMAQQPPPVGRGLLII